MRYQKPTIKHLSMILFALSALVACSDDDDNPPNPLVIDQIQAGDDHSCALVSDGRLYCWGRNQKGQLGLGETEAETILEATRVGADSNWTTLSANFDHTCAINSDRELYCWGGNEVGQLGVGHIEDQNTPQRVPNPQNWLRVATGNNHTCAIARIGSGGEAGDLYCWGEGEDGKLGRGAADTATYNTPQRVGSMSDWREVYAAEDHSCALRGDPGGLYCWGLNNDGELGIGNEDNQSAPARVSGATNWLLVGAGAEHTCAVSTANELYCWGENNDGELGINDANSEFENTPQRVGSVANWRDVGAGGNQSCAVNSLGRLFCWGRNDVGQVGTGGNDSPVLSPQRVGMMQDWTLIDGGDDHNCAIGANGGVYCWGDNSNGQLGSGDTVQANTPRRVDFGFSLGGGVN